MDTNFLHCERCQTILTGEMVNTPAPRPCPGCGTPLLARVFPAFFRPPDTRAIATGQDALASDEDASCFFHPRKKAAVDCASCGRFLCDLCDIELDDHHLCPTCVENSRGKGDATDKAFVREHYRYDQLALNMAILPMFLVFMWFASFITAPLTLYFVVRYWKTPRLAIIPRGHGRQILAGTLATLQIVGWITFFSSTWAREVTGFRPHRPSTTTHGSP